ncbi:hypothetical protein HU200_049012 [Digitaria exilis]|uniref:Uncharacterized protein n=1 Tax=Digitaria exilis TaxID=1010633 RepID=A0A835AV43_9POAL|nr:hypothetical protein HU200_049012 [Digitaria exilis]
MAAMLSPQLTAPVPFVPTLRPRPRRLPPPDAFAASVSPLRIAGLALRGYRRCNPVARRFHRFENTISLWTEHNKQALFASDQDSPSTDTKQSSSSSPGGPPILTILAGVIVFLLVLWVAGSILTWIVGLAFGTAK